MYLIGASVSNSFQSTFVFGAGDVRPRATRTRDAGLLGPREKRYIGDARGDKFVMINPTRSVRRAAFAVLIGLLAGPTGLPVRAVTSLITAAECEQVGANTYQIAYQTAGRSEAVGIYASASPTRLETPTPVLTTTTSPVTVSITPRTGRVYFHLRPESG